MSKVSDTTRMADSCNQGNQVKLKQALASVRLGVCMQVVVLPSELQSDLVSLLGACMQAIG